MIILQSEAFQRRILRKIMNGRHLILPSFLIVIEEYFVQLKINITAAQVVILLQFLNLFQLIRRDIWPLEHFLFDDVRALGFPLRHYFLIKSRCLPRLIIPFQFPKI